MTRLLSTAIIFGAFACQTNSAQAMLIDALGETIQHSSSSLETTGASAPAEKPQPVTRPNLLWQDLLPQALYALGNGHNGPSGMGSAGTGGASSGAVQAAFCASDEGSFGMIVAYLTRESTLLTPIPFLDGVFRPPDPIPTTSSS